MSLPATFSDVASETALQTSRIRTILRDICCTASSILTLSVALRPELQAKTLQAAGGLQEDNRASQSVKLNSLPDISTVDISTVDASAAANNPVEKPRDLSVIGFMGGRIKGDNFVHMEARMAKELQRRYPVAVHAAVFANHDGHVA